MLILLGVVLCLQTGRAEKLPIKIYTSADGLSSSAITHVARDSQGFLWFSSRDGVSRFDGTEFVNYRLPEPASSQTFRYFLETRDGWIWFATDEGLYRTRREDVSDVKPRPATEGRDRVLNVRKVWDGFSYVLFEDRRGTMWIGGTKLHQVTDREGEQISVRTIETPHTDLTHVFWLADAADGSLWLSQLEGPVRILPDGRQIVYPISRSAPGDEVFAIDVREDGRVWFGQAGGLFVFLPGTIDELNDLPGGSSGTLTERTAAVDAAGSIKLPSESGDLLRIAAGERATAVKESDEGVFAAIDNSLFLFQRDGSYRRIGAKSVLTGTTRSIVTDLNNGLWLGSTGGAIQFIQDGLASYGSEDGLVDPQISSIFESPSGDLLIAHGLWGISRFTDDGFETTALNLPGDIRFTWTSGAIASGPNGDLFALAREGLFRFPFSPDLKFLAAQQPEVFPDLTRRPFYRAYAARDGNLWFSLRGYAEENGLLRFDPRTGVFEDMSTISGFPLKRSPASFAEDRAGNLWIGFYGIGGLLKYSGGVFREYDLGIENARGTLALLTDRQGRLWIGSTSHGVLRIKDPTREPFEIERIDDRVGLASNNVRAMVEDEMGNVYVGTVRGVDRVSAATDAIRHFSAADGLAADFINAAFRDRRGSLWFGTPNGLSRLAPTRDERPTPPGVLIGELQIAGESYLISQFGQTAVGGIDLASEKNNLQIDVVGVGSKLRYQYKLEGSGVDEWSRPDPVRNFNFANLAPGSYTFLVRAVSSAGVPSEVPARISFVINPPFYRRWWFIGLALLTAAGSVFALDRYRVSKTRQVQTAYDDLRRSEDERRYAEAALEQSRQERLAELERVRTRIATDLHDDIGSSLTQIAVLSQAAHSQVEREGGANPAPLQRISDVSIELVNAMSDIVWAINPRRDNLRDLVQRMRRFAADVFTARGIRFEFHAPATEVKLPIGANIRREAFAIFKEAVNNVVRHSGAKRATIALSVTDEELSIEITDDGQGFDAEAQMHITQAPESGGGNGLVNMVRRARDLGGSCDIDSSPGSGTVVTLRVPLAGPFYPDGNGDEPTSQAVGDSDG